MNLVYKVLYFLQGTMERPTPYGWFHMMWILLTIITIFILYKQKDKHSEKQLNIILFIYGFIAFLLELLKQIIWSFNYNSVTNVVTWDYQWYAFPFQLCTTPIYVSLICLFLKNDKIKKPLFSYISFITILGSIVTILIPDSCFVETTLVNIHTMYLHCGSLVLSIYLLIAKEVEINRKNLIDSYKVFFIFLVIASCLNIIMYNTNILNGETFNMFYISPYFITHLPVFDIVQKNVPYFLYLIFYICVILSGGIIVYNISNLIKCLVKKGR